MAEQLWLPGMRPDESQSFWEHVDRVSAEVQKWPTWKRGGWCPEVHEGGPAVQDVPVLATVMCRTAADVIASMLAPLKLRYPDKRRT